MKTVIVGSNNQVKVSATHIGFQRMFCNDEFQIKSFSAKSGVSDQPIGDKEIFQGAKNRALHCKQEFPDADFWVGIEGGIEKVHDSMEAYAWIVILSGDKEGKARSCSFFLPRQVTELVESGLELGDANDKVFGSNNSKSGGGATGLLTGGVYPRISLYETAVILALIPFKSNLEF